MIKQKVKIQKLYKEEKDIAQLFITYALAILGIYFIKAIEAN